jgi:hypothetical protein
MTRAEITEIVRQKLDEVSQFTAYQVDSVNLIDSFLDSAAEKILMAVPLHLIPPTDFSTESQDARSDGSGIVALPSDFLRLSSFKMTEWDRPISHPISQEHPLYNLQKNTITRGKPSKPVCVIGYYNSSYSSGDGQGFLTPGYYTGNYPDIPTNAEITQLIGDATNYTPADNFLIRDTSGTGNTYWVYSDQTTWQVNSAIFQPAQ